MGANPFPYIVPVLSRPLQEELVKGEHFVLADLLKSISGSSSQAGSAQEPQAEIAKGALVSFVRPDIGGIGFEAYPLGGKKEEGKDQGYQRGVRRLRGVGGFNR